MQSQATTNTVVQWRPFKDTSQERFLACPFRFILYSGTRGPGKTESSLIKFHRHTGQGWGADWRGIILSQEYKNLDDIVKKGKKLFLALNIGVRWLSSKDTYKFIWPCGAELLLRVAKNEDDYWDYHGHEYPFVLIEELTKYPESGVYDKFVSLNRSSVPGIPKYYIATTNPYGAGHHWVKARFIDPKPILTSKGSVINLQSRTGRKRKLIRFDGDILENEYLVANDPDYIAELDDIEDDQLRKAWRYGSWDVNVGAYFHGYLSQESNMIEPFVPPIEWRRWRSYDFGSNKPWAIGYYAIDPDGIIYKYRELYGWTGKPDEGSGETWQEICNMMDEAEEWEKKNGAHFWNNPADHNIFTNQGHEADLAEKFASRGYVWIKAQKGPGSKVNGLNLMKDLFKQGLVKITSDCTNFWRTVPNLQVDEKNWEVTDTTQEDHICDETMYSLVSRHMKSHKRKEAEKKQQHVVANSQYAHLR